MRTCVNRFARGTADLWDRLKVLVSHMVDRLNEPESRFHASLVSNVLDLINLLPKLNVSDDQELNRFAGEIRNKLCGFTARDLKTNDVLRVKNGNPEPRTRRTEGPDPVISAGRERETSSACLFVPFLSQRVQLGTHCYSSTNSRCSPEVSYRGWRWTFS